MPKPDAEESARSQRVRPDPNVCRTRIIGPFSPFPACMVDNPAVCQFTLSMGEDWCCIHPNGRAFIKG